MNKTSIKHISFLILLLISFSSISQVYKPGFEPSAAPKPPSAETKFPEANAFINSNVTYKIFDAANNTFSYDIFGDGKLLIHQPSIPGMPGNEGFKTKASAETIAKLVVSKIKKGEMPPTVTIEEMKKLKAIPQSVKNK